MVDHKEQVVLSQNVDLPDASSSRQCKGRNATLMPLTVDTECLLVVQELRHAYEEERKANDRLIEQSDKDRQTIDDLEGRSVGSCRA